VASNANAASINSGIFNCYAQTPPTLTPRSEIDLSRYGSLPTGPNQLFTEQRDPASRYLLAVDPNLPLNLQLLSPEALLEALGVAAIDVRFLADPLSREVGRTWAGHNCVTLSQLPRPADRSTASPCKPHRRPTPACRAVPRASESPTPPCAG